MDTKRIRALIVPLYLKLYDDAEPEARGRLMPIIDAVSGCVARVADAEVMAPVTTPEDVRDMERRAADRDAIVLLHLAYSPSLLVADALKRAGKPLLMVDTTLDDGFSRMSDTYCMSNHAIHAVMDLASVLRSMGVGYRLCVGHHGDGRFARRLEAEIRLLTAAVRYRGQRIAMTGGPFPMMGDFAIDRDDFSRRFGHRIVDIGEEEIEEEMRGVGTGDLDEACAGLLGSCAFSGDLGALRVSVCQSIALDRLLERHRVDAYTMDYNCFERTPVPFLAINDMMAKGVGYAGEGDILTASLGMPLGILGGRAMFSEFFCPDWHRDLVIMSHMGEANPAFAGPGQRIGIREKRPLGRAITAHYYEFGVEAGTLTFVTWRKEPDGGLSLLTGVLERVESEGFEAFGAPHFVARPRGSLADFLERYSVNGGGHHLYLVEGDVRESVTAFAGLIGVGGESM